MAWYHSPILLNDVVVTKGGVLLGSVAEGYWLVPYQVMQSVQYVGHADMPDTPLVILGSANLAL